MKYVCDVCGWEYDEEKGYPEGGIHRVQWEDFRMILMPLMFSWQRSSFLRAE